MNILSAWKSLRHAGGIDFWKSKSKAIELGISRTIIDFFFFREHSMTEASSSKSMKEMEEIERNTHTIYDDSSLILLDTLSVHLTSLQTNPVHPFTSIILFSHAMRPVVARAFSKPNNPGNKNVTP